MSEKKTNHSVSFEALSSLDAPVSFWKGIPFGLQHVMAMFVANLAPIFIVASAAKMTPAQSATIIQSGLLVAGLGTCLQLYGAWLIGSRLPMVTGISFTYVAAAVAICADKGYGAVVGAVMVGGLLELVLGLTAKYWRRFVPPIVSAIVVTSIGFSLLNVGATSFGGGSGDFGFFKFFETQDTTNSDEVIEISSTAPGTSYVPAGTSFSDEYIADPSHHVSPDGSIDTSTAYFEKTTWYFNKQYHELTNNNIALNLAYDIAMNKVKSIDDCKDTYPQFNNVRNLKKLNRYLGDAEQVFKLGVLSAEDDAALKSAVANANSVIANTVIDPETDNKTTENMRSIMAELVAKYDLATEEVKEQLDYDGLQRGDYKPASEPDKTTVVLTTVLGAVAKILTLIFGKQGFGDFWSFIF